MPRPQLTKGTYIKNLSDKNSLMRTYPNDDNFEYDGLKRQSLFYCLGYKGPCLNNNILTIKACDAYTSKGLCKECTALFKKAYLTKITLDKIKIEESKAQSEPIDTSIFDSWMD